MTWLTNKHAAAIFAVLVAVIVAAVPRPGHTWSVANMGKGGMILWPMFGATNQLLGGLSFLVITFYLWRRRKPIWFLVVPMLFMLVMPAWAMLIQLREWTSASSPNYALLVVTVATLVLEAWMIVEALLLWPQTRGVAEHPAGLPVGATAITVQSPQASSPEGVRC